MKFIEYVEQEAYNTTRSINSTLKPKGTRSQDSLNFDS